jgi:hypothetical protein
MSPIIQHNAVPNRDKDTNRRKFGPDATSCKVTEFRDLALNRSRLHHSDRNDSAEQVALVRTSLRLTLAASLRMSEDTVSTPSILMSSDIGVNPAGWHDMDRLCCEATRIRSFQVEFSWHAGFQMRVLTEASCACGILPLHGSAALRNQFSTLCINVVMSKFSGRASRSSSVP